MCVAKTKRSMNHWLFNRVVCGCAHESTFRCCNCCGTEENGCDGSHYHRRWSRWRRHWAESVHYALTVDSAINFDAWNWLLWLLVTVAGKHCNMLLVWLQCSVSSMVGTIQCHNLFWSRSLPVALLLSCNWARIVISSSRVSLLPNRKNHYMYLKWTSTFSS